MKKMFLILLAVLLLSAPAWAGGQTFGPFTVDVPDGWQSEYLTEGGNAALQLTKGDGVVVIFGLGNLEGEGFADYIAFLTENAESEADAPKKQADGSWLIVDAQDNSTARYLPVEGDTHVLCIMINGSDPDIEGLSKSLKLNPKAKL